MTHRLLHPLAIAIGMGLFTSAAAAPASVFDVHELDSNISACNDFNGFVNAKWVAAHPIPNDRTRWGSFDVLREDSLNVQRKLVERAASQAAAAAAGSIEQKIGYLYGSGMDEAAIDKAGFDPIKPQLARIAALRHNADMVAYIRDSYARGEPVLFRFGGNADFKDSNQEIAYAVQGGLGLPTADYYSKADFAEIRDAYVAHIARLLELPAHQRRRAQAQAEAVLAFETRLAKASLPPVEMRKPENRYHFVSIADADKVTPHFDWAEFFKAQNADVDNGFSLSQPKFFAEMDKMLDDVPAAQWQAYFALPRHRDAAPYLSNAVPDENFAFTSKTLNGQKEQQPRWKRVLERPTTTWAWRSASCTSPTTSRRSPSSARRSWSTNLRAALKARIEKLDWMSAETKQKALEKWATFVPKIGYPDKWRDWSGLTHQAARLLRQRAAPRKFDYDYQHRARSASRSTAANGA